MKRFLVTAGNTRERIDDVRDWGNIFTGNTGYQIAQALAEIGQVHLLTSNRAHLQEISQSSLRLTGSAFTTHAELRAALAALMAAGAYDAVFMTAAVSDYRPAGAFAVVSREKLEGDVERWTVRNVQAGKVKSNHGQIAILGEQTEKIVDLFRTEWNFKGLLVKFKLEVGIGREELLKIGQASRIASGADYLVANTLAMVGGEQAGAYLISESDAEWIPRGELATRMGRLVRDRLGA